MSEEEDINSNQQKTDVKIFYINYKSNKAAILLAAEVNVVMHSLTRTN